MLHRRSMLAAGAAAAIVPLRARAAQFTYKLGNNLPLTHPLNIRLQEAIGRIREATKGAVEIQVFPNNQLGGDTDMLSQVRSGAIEFLTLSGLILSTLVPVASINGIGFAFKDYAQVWPTMDGELGAYVRDAISKAGLIAFEKMWDNGFRQTTTSTRPIATPADFKGMKMRVPVSPLWTSHVPGARRLAHEHQLRRGLFRVADACRGWRGEPARGDRAPPSSTRCRNTAP